MQLTYVGMEMHQVVQILENVKTILLACRRPIVKNNTLLTGYVLVCTRCVRVREGGPVGVRVLKGTCALVF